MMRLDKESGFSLIELITALALIVILAAIALPAFRTWQSSASYKAVARTLALTLRDARSRAVTTGLQHRVVVDVDGSRFQVDRGNLAFGSTAWPTSFGQVVAPANSDLKSGAGCDQDTDVTLIFSPNGSCDSVPTICILDENGVRRFRIAIGSMVSGRVVID